MSLTVANRQPFRNMNNENAPNIVSFEDGWRQLKSEAIVALYRKIELGYGKVQFDKKESLRIYTLCYQMCTQPRPYNWTGMIYKEYKKEVSERLGTVVGPAIQSLKGERMLRELVRRWKEHKIFCKWTTKLFGYVNRFYIHRLATPSLQDAATEIFRELVFEQVQTSIREAFLESVSTQRSGQHVNTLLLRQISDIFIELGGSGNLSIYEECLEKYYLEALQEACANCSERWLASDDLPSYARKAEIYIEEEIERVKNYLDESSLPKVLIVVEAELLGKPSVKLFSKEANPHGAHELFERRASMDLQRIFRMYTRSKRLFRGLKLFANSFRTFILREGTKEMKKTLASSKSSREKGKRNRQKGSVLSNAEIMADETPATLIDRLVIMHKEYTASITSLFKDDVTFHEALKRGFEEFMNVVIEDNFSVPELLANYFDLRLRRDGRFSNFSISELANELGCVSTMFTYVREKDVFQEFYRKGLAKRLLLRRSSGEDSEREAINKLRGACGTQFTSRIEGMIRDMNNGKDIQNSFRAWTRQTETEDGEPISPTARTLTVDFNIQVLTMGFWPSYKVDKITMPHQFQRCMDLFTEYYESRTANRVLKWIHSLGFVTVIGRFAAMNGSRLEMVMSTHQGAIMMHFNRSSGQVLVADLCDSLGLEIADIKKHLRPLLEGKFRLLKATAADTESLTTSSTVSVNDGFSCNQRKIKIPLHAGKTTNKERQKNIELVQLRRKHQTEAAIVRLLKARGRISKTDLMTEVTKDLMKQFTPQPAFLKKRIEDLISRDYLEVSEDNPNEYVYV